MAKIIDFVTRQVLFNGPVKKSKPYAQLWKFTDNDPYRYQLYTIASNQVEAIDNLHRAKSRIYEVKAS